MMRITRIKATPVRIARSILLTTSYGATPDSSTVVVEVETSEGLVGLGQTTSAAPWYGDSVAAIMEHLDGSLAPAMVGCDPLNIEDAVRRMDHVLPGALFAKTGLEFADASVGWMTRDCGGLIDQVTVITTSDGGVTWAH